MSRQPNPNDKKRRRRRDDVATRISAIPRHRLDEIMVVSKLLSEGTPQNKVAETLRKGEAAITRLKKEAIACGILRVTYHPPRLRELEHSLRRRLGRYGVRDVLVSPRDAGAAAARRFGELVKAEETLVLDGGLTVSNFVAALAWSSLPELHVVPLCADPPSYVASAYECMTRLATLFPGVVACEKLPHFSSPELTAQHQRIREMAADANTLVLGCGPWQRGFTASEFVRNLGLSPEKIRKKYGQVTSVCGYCALADDGRHVRLPEVERLMPRAIDFEGIVGLASRKKSQVILLAETAAKAESVLTVIAAGMTNVLVVDEPLAARLLVTLESRIHRTRSPL